MGILNVTPDSFSDGGRWLDADAAVRHGLALIGQGAAIVDVGGESTRPGAERVSAEEELRRVVPVVAGLAEQGVQVSVDTMRTEVARAAVDAGASIVNDVSGGKADPAMLDFVAGSEADLVLMHWRAHSVKMQHETHYDDVVADVIAELTAQRDHAVGRGVLASRIILDPGIGFSKTFEQNWDLLRGLGRFRSLGHRVLLGASRKGFLGAALGSRPAEQRDAATAALTTWAAVHGLWAVRTHEVATQVDAAEVGRRLGNIQVEPAE